LKVLIADDDRLSLLYLQDAFIARPFNAEELQVRIRAGRRISELGQQLRLKAPTKR
jgi:DNA-binding response OmpR family regulator